MFYPNIARFVSVGLATALVISTASAQSVDNGKEDASKVKAPEGFIVPRELLKVAYRQANPWTLRTNLRFSSAKSTVRFGNLGEVPAINIVPGSDQSVALRGYDDGGVLTDSARAAEKDANGNVTSTPGGTYSVDVSGTQLGEFLSYTPGQTRSWAFYNDSQAMAGGIAMHTYSAVSRGAQAAADHEGSGAGFELAVGRRIYKLGDKTEINLTGSVGLTDIKAKTSGTVISDLVTMTDLYELYGTAPAAPFTGPTFADLNDVDGVLVLTNGLETTPPLQQVTANRTYLTTPNGATVNGDWELTGAYYSIRVGPQLRSHLSERLALTAGVGVVGGFVGTDYTVTETLNMGSYVVGAPLRVSTTSQHNEFIVGFYGEVAVELWLSPRTAFFAGATYETLGDYEQTLSGRTANVDLGNNLVIQFGIVTRF